MATIKSLRVMMYVDHTQVKKGMAMVEKEVRNGAKRINRTLATALGAGFVGLGASLFKSLQVAARRQKLEVGSAVLGGTDKLWQDINRRASNSSIASDEWLSGANRLLGAGVAVEDIMGLMESLAQVSAGTGSSIKELGLVYSQVFAKGRLQGEEMLQFMERNINLMPALQKHLGKSADEIKKMQAEGKILAKDVAEALRIMTSGDGRFAGMDQAMLSTLAGSWQYLINRINFGFERVGKTLTPIVGVIAGELGYWLGPSGPIAVGLDMIAATLSVILMPFVAIAVVLRWIDTITWGWASTLAMVVLSFSALVLLAKTLLPIMITLFSVSRLQAWASAFLAFGKLVLWVYGAIIVQLSAITGLTYAWIGALTLGIVPLVLFIAWVIRGIYRGLTESLRKEQKKAEEIQKKNKAIADRRQSAGALFGTDEAYGIVNNTIQDQNILMAQLKYLEIIADNTADEERIAEKERELYDSRTNREFAGVTFHVTGDSAMARFRALNNM